jgi:non-heme chloroperoxidase
VDPVTSRLITLPDGVELSYSDQGQGPTILLLHGVCMSRRFFERNLAGLSAQHRVIAVDFRSHGDSPRVEGGHTVAQYARDVRGLIEALGLHDVTLLGWSMGSLVVWDYLHQYGGDRSGGDHRLAGVVIVSQGPSDLTQPGWDHGVADVPTLHGYVALMQDDLAGFFAGFVPLMFKSELDPATHARLLEAIVSVGANAGALIFLDQTLRDYRPLIPTFTVPHLLVWGRDEKVVPVASAEWLLEALPSAELHLFEESGHCPMWEQPGEFNDVVTGWIAR